MKSVIDLVGDLNSLGFDYDTYIGCKQNKSGKKYINDVWHNVVKDIKFPASFLVKLKNMEPFKDTITSDGNLWDVQHVIKENHTHMLIGRVKSETRQELAFSAELHGSRLHQLLIGQDSTVKQGCYYDADKYSLNFKYFNGTGDNTYSISLNFDYHTYDIRINKDQVSYHFREDKLIKFTNHAKDVRISFFKFTNSKKYKASEVVKGKSSVSYFYKGNVRCITKRKGKRELCTVYYSTGVIKSAHSYCASTGLMDGDYIIYDRNGLIKEKLPYKMGSLHGIYEKYIEGIIHEKIQYKNDSRDGLYYKMEDGVETIKTYVRGIPIKKKKEA